MKTLERDYKMVQPIVVLYNESVEHDSLVVAAANASVECFKQDNDNWREWREGNYAKTVRRAKDKEFEKIVQFAAEQDVQSFVSSVANSKAVAFEPCTYDDMPKLIRRTPVSGLELPRNYHLENKDEVLRWSKIEDSPCLVVNDSLNMSTGKCAAQVAHAMWLAVNAGYAAGSLDVTDVHYVDNRTFTELSSYAKGVITDSGLTELSGPTRTVMML